MPDQPHPLIFNLSRLASRQHSSTPTGVDRVDLRHARFVLEQSDSTAVVFVYQRKNVLRRAPAEQARELINNLWQRWVLSKPLQPLQSASRANRLMSWAQMKYRRRTNTLISTGIKRALAGQPDPIYLNSGQVGVHHLDLHQQLVDQLGADIIFYLHDLIPIDYPEYARNLAGVTTHRQRMATMAQTATIILTNSEYTKNRFQEYGEHHQLRIPSLHVLNIGVEERFVEARTQPKNSMPEQLADKLNKPYFVAVGTIEPRKNHLLLLHLWRQMASELQDDCPKLVIVGRRGWGNENIIDLLDRSPAIRQHVIELNRVNDNDMLALIQNAQALLLPSFEEGWGIPVTEALTVGTPVICSDIQALRESSQGAATVIDPLDGPAWRTAIDDHIAEAPAVSDEYRPHTWPGHLQQLAKYSGPRCPMSRAPDASEVWSQSS